VKIGYGKSDHVLRITTCKLQIAKPILMTAHELHELRRHKWRLDGRPVRTIEEAREFVESVGFCLMYPISPHAPGVPPGTEIVAPTFIGACTGGVENLPTRQKAFSDPRARTASEIAVRLLRQRSAYQANVFGEDNLLVAAGVFPYFYALAGERNPRQEPRANRSLSPLAQDVLSAIQTEGPVAKRRLPEKMRGDLSEAAIDRALSELASRLLITRIDHNPRNGSSWDVLYRWSPKAVNEGMHLSVAVALSALISKYLDGVIAADEKQISDFFLPLIARSKVKEALNTLLAARELEFIPVGSRTLVQLAAARTTERPPGSRRRA
jgi:23S rRNA pseudouridine2605 synthase